MHLMIEGFGINASEQGKRFLEKRLEAKQRVYGGDNLKVLHSLMGDTAEMDPDLPIKELAADRFGAHLLFTASVDGRLTGVSLFEAELQEFLDLGEHPIIAATAALRRTAAILNVPYDSGLMWYHTRNDDPRTPEGLTPAEWLLSDKQ